jgi:hypothetical protein
MFSLVYFSLHKKNTDETETDINCLFFYTNLILCLLF